MEWLQNLSEHAQLWLPNPWFQASLWILGGVVASQLVLFIFNHLNWLGASRTKNRFDDLLLEKCKNPLRWTIIFIAVYYGFAQLPHSEELISVIFSIEVTLAIFIWGNVSYRLMVFLLQSSSQSRKASKLVQKRTLPLFENLLFVVIIATGIYFVLVAWDINVGPLIASAGILGLAMSLAAKDTMANLFAGVFIMADAPYQLGDYIVLDTGERGKVTHIGIRSTRILTRDDVEITIPNAIMGNTKIINESAGPYEKFRIRIRIGLAYGSDIQQIRQVLMDVATQNQSICHDPEPRVRFRTFGDSALQFELLCWVPNPELRGRVSDQLNEEVYNALNQKHIKIPFPQQEIHLTRSK